MASVFHFYFPLFFVIGKKKLFFPKTYRFVIKIVVCERRNKRNETERQRGSKREAGGKSFVD